MNTEPRLEQRDEPAKGFARIATFLYAVSLLVTSAVVFLLDFPFGRPGHTWINYTVLLFGESFLYGIVLYYLVNGQRSRKLIPVYLGMITVAGTYLVVVLSFILIFSWALNVSVVSYALLQFIALGIAAIAIGLLAIYMKNAESQEQGA
ncbi:hypothetical protein [Cohnella panacarvi]|uniref:hypothetical protein n=1 Tax=Cohnella panacarvi TaxID=400776 RepID=UPI000478BB8C|nr:hypothetical protein [Cohnella panacarvi]